MNLMKNIKLRKVKAGQASGGTAVTSSVVDMANFDGVIFFCTIGTANAGNFMKIQQGAVSDLSDAADLEGTKVVATGDGEGVWVDVYRPQERYLRAYIDRSGADTTTGDIYAIQYSGRKQPIDNNVTDTIIGELHVSPDEGTA